MESNKKCNEKICPFCKIANNARTESSKLCCLKFSIWVERNGECVEDTILK